jgi:hypothetical protein
MDKFKVVSAPHRIIPVSRLSWLKRFLRGGQKNPHVRYAETGPARKSGTQTGGAVKS